MLGKALGDQQGYVDESVHAVREACLGFAVELCTRLVHALVPADVVELVDLQEEKGGLVYGLGKSILRATDLLGHLHPLFLHHQKVLQL